MAREDCNSGLSGVHQIGSTQREGSHYVSPISVCQEAPPAGGQALRGELIGQLALAVATLLVLPALLARGGLKSKPRMDLAPRMSLLSSFSVWQRNLHGDPEPCRQRPGRQLLLTPGSWTLSGSSVQAGLKEMLRQINKAIISFQRDII